MTKRRIVIASRESPLALQQTNIVKDLLQKHHPHLEVDILGITTEADRLLDRKVIEIGGKSAFVKELEDALLDGRADIAVHSMKDVPMALPPGLVLPVIGEREDVRDAFISNQYQTLMQLPAHAVLGTSSLRRQTQISAMRNDLELRNIRGNINTRLKKLDEGAFDAIILASAGMKRMNFASRIRSYLAIEEVLPATGQGALGIECREDDEATLAVIACFNHPVSSACVMAERAASRHLGGGCHVPVAAYGQIVHDELHLQGMVANSDGTRILRARLIGNMAKAEAMGLRLAEELLQQGAAKILKEYD